MLNLSNTLKTVAIAAFVGAGALGASLSSASADTIETRCNGFGECYRVRCDDYRDTCWRVGYYGSGYTPGRRWVCDADGEDCHWSSYDSDGYYHRHYYAPGVDLHF